jgi:hypothetical protein
MKILIACEESDTVRSRFDKKTGKQKRNPMWLYKAFRENKPGERSKIRSKTFDGIAEAMSSQWGAYLIEKNSYSISIH